MSRSLRSAKTRLNFPDRLALDPVNGEIFVVEARDSNHPSILVFPRDAQGDVAPMRALGGPDTGIGGGTASVAIDATSNALIYAGSNALLVFNRTDTGNVKPRRVISGPATLISTGIQNVRVIGRWILLAIGGGDGRASFVGVWGIDDNGDVPPRWTIGGPNGTLKKARGAAAAPDRRTVTSAVRQRTGDPGRCVARKVRDHETSEFLGKWNSWPDGRIRAGVRSAAAP